MVFMGMAAFVLDDRLGLRRAEQFQGTLTYDDSGSASRQAVGHGSTVLEEIRPRVLGGLPGEQIQQPTMPCSCSDSPGDHGTEAGEQDDQEIGREGEAKGVRYAKSLQWVSAEEAGDQVAQSCREAGVIPIAGNGQPSPDA
jgi:hypothetical protein